MIGLPPVLRGVRRSITDESETLDLLGSGDLVPVKIGSMSFIPAAGLDLFVEGLAQTAASSRR